MATRSKRAKQNLRQQTLQKKAEQQRRKRQRELENRKRAEKFGDRLQKRLANQVPHAWPDELSVDVAMFDDSVLARLPSDEAQQVLAVREALSAACDGDGERAMELVGEISRGSLSSQWRLFVRGLVAWLGDDYVAASEAWRRLEGERRPSRIAAVLMASRQLDTNSALRLEHAPDSEPPRPRVRPHLQPHVKLHASSTSDLTSEPESERVPFLDSVQKQNAELLYRIRFDRAAIRIATAGTSAADEDKELLIGPRKIQWLKEFCAAHRASEPALVASLEQVALGRAVLQGYYDLFELAAAAFEGPNHDVKNNLLRHFFYLSGDTAKRNTKSEMYLDQYLSELRANTRISARLKGAIESELHLARVDRLVVVPTELASTFGFRRDSNPANRKAIQASYRAAIGAYPANRVAHDRYVVWLQSIVELETNLSKTEESALQCELLSALEAWSKSLPDESKPRELLVRRYLDEERLEDAKPHADWLSASRHDDPRVRALPWKWQLLAAMRFCRRKVDASKAEACLAQMPSLWPAWLSRQWLPYLQAAVAMRRGDTASLDARLIAARAEFGMDANSVVDNCMLMAAAQRMRVPNERLKPMRMAIDQVLKNPKSIPWEDLLDAGAFFWDLYRMEISYPGYRAHGPKLMSQLVARLNADPSLLSKQAADRRMQSALLWCSQSNQFQGHHSATMPNGFERVEHLPIFLASKVNAGLKLSFPPRGIKGDAERLAAAAKQEADPFYRFWLADLVEQVRNGLDMVDTGECLMRAMFEAFGGLDGDQLDGLDLDGLDLGELDLDDLDLD